MEIAVIERPGRLLRGHLWVFSNELSGSPRRYSPGSLVELRDRSGGFLGIGYVNPASLIAVRVLSRERVPIDLGFIRQRVVDALDFRRRVLPADRASFRAVFSEGDGLPGLIADKYGDCLSVQFLTLGMERLSEIVLDALREVYSPSIVVLRNDSPSRSLEGLPLEKRVIAGSLERPPVVREGALAFEVDPLSGQKTGFFLDQSENRAAFGAMTAGGEALDLFSYTGAWGVAMAARGASVTFVDSSASALEGARRNAGINGVADRCAFVKSDVFEFMKAQAAAGRRYDRIALDPPAFVKNAARIKEALRAYRSLNAAALGLLKKGALMATSSCSYHVDRAAFLDMLRAAARDAGRTVRVVEVRSQARDHPALLSVPETEYLKCAFLEAG
jgi:23S rRNA (cytosine1962-C5)-methyltransferase